MILKVKVLTHSFWRVRLSSCLLVWEPPAAFSFDVWPSRWLSYWMWFPRFCPESCPAFQRSQDGSDPDPRDQLPNDKCILNWSTMCFESNRHQTLPQSFKSLSNKKIISFQTSFFAKSCLICAVILTCWLRRTPFFVWSFSLARRNNFTSVLKTRST